MVLLQIMVRIVSLLRHHVEMRHRHDDRFVRLRNDLKGITHLMNHQAQHVKDDYACKARDDWNRSDKQTQRAKAPPCVCKTPAWITEVAYDTFRGLAKACKEDSLDEEDLPQWTKKVIGGIWTLVLEDDEARNVFMKSSTWRSSHF